ncbi:MAG: hypothetical protein ACKOWF_00865, partial [Chloroflexota bacterium]
VEAGDEVLRMERHLSLEELARHAAGEAVSLAWAPEDARFIPADDQEPAAAAAAATAAGAAR